MEVGDQGPEPILSHVEPVFAVRDISETLKYWQDILGFPSKWTWGDPPNHGGVSWQKIFIQFTLNPVLAASSKGNSIWIRVERVESFYHFHQKNNAEIVAPLEDKPWGLAQYTLREINGYYVHFSGPVATRERTEKKLPSTVRVLGRPPAIKEYQRLGSAVGWAPMSEEDAALRLAAVLHSSVAEDTVSGEVIGCALLVGDHASYYYIMGLARHLAWCSMFIGPKHRKPRSRINHPIYPLSLSCLPRYRKTPKAGPLIAGTGQAYSSHYQFFVSWPPQPGPGPAAPLAEIEFFLSYISFKRYFGLTSEKGICA